MAEELYTTRLHLRKMQASDSAQLFAIWSDPAVTEFMNISVFTDEQQATEMIQLLEDLAAANEALRFTIIERNLQEIIGTCGFNHFDFDKASAEIGYDIAKAHWGKGYAPEAIAALIRYAFEELHIQRIEAKVDPANKNSIHVLQKLHFTFEGTLKEQENGRFVDLHLYSLLKNEERLPHRERHLTLGGAVFV